MKTKPRDGFYLVTLNPVWTVKFECVVIQGKLAYMEPTKLMVSFHEEVWKRLAKFEGEWEGVTFKPVEPSEDAVDSYARLYSTNALMSELQKAGRAIRENTPSTSQLTKRTEFLKRCLVRKAADAGLTNKVKKTKLYKPETVACPICGSNTPENPCGNCGYTFGVPQLNYPNDEYRKSLESKMDFETQVQGQWISDEVVPTRPSEDDMMQKPTNHFADATAYVVQAAPQRYRDIGLRVDRYGNVKVVESEVCENAVGEKRRRVYYQNIVYRVCNELDRIVKGSVVCGTVNDPSTQTEEAVKLLTETLLRYQNEKTKEESQTGTQATETQREATGESESS